MVESKYGNRYNRRKIAEVYKSGKTVDEIATMANCHRSTIYNHLKAAGVEMRDDRLTLPGPARKTVCGAGEHALTDFLDDGQPNPNLRVDKRGERHCRACEARRGRRRRFNKLIQQHIEQQGVIQ